MIVIGIDPHMKSHTAVALDGASGRRLGELTVAGTDAGCEKLLAWARRLGGERVIAIEDCRHVSRPLERRLLPAGERLLRVPPKMMAQARASARSYGKSDPLDAECVARAALREPDLPEARLDGPERDLRLLSDHRDDLLAERRRIQLRLRWHLHDLELDLRLPSRALDRYVWLERIEAALSDLEPTTCVRIALELTARCRELTQHARCLEREIRGLMRVLAPELLELPGCSALAGAQLVGQVGGAARFRGEAAFAMHTGTAPLPASSGVSTRHRLNRRGNRTLNHALHIIAVTQARMHPPAIAFMARKQGEGMSYREALRCLKRHIARCVFRTMRRAEVARLGEASGHGVTSVVAICC